MDRIIMIMNNWELINFILRKLQWYPRFLICKIGRKAKVFYFSRIRVLIINKILKNIKVLILKEISIITKIIKTFNFKI